MEKDRNVNFDSDVEVDSLKDAVWRLTTRVYLLEDFITEQFGQVIGPSGFTKIASQTQESSSPFPCRSNNEAVIIGENRNVSRRGRKRKKVGNSSKSEVGTSNSKIPSTGEKTETPKGNHNISITIGSSTAQPSENEPARVKSEPLAERYSDDDFDGNDFMNYNSDDADDPNDSMEKDPDFVPSSDSLKVESEKGRNSTSTSKDGSKGKKNVWTWTLLKTYTNAKEAEESLREDGYTLQCTNVNLDGKVEYFLCNTGRRKCPYRLKLQHFRNAAVNLWENNVEHNHEHLGQRSLSKELKDEVVSLLSIGISKPNQIITHLTEKYPNAQPPDKIKLTNFLAYYRKKNTSHTDSGQEKDKTFTNQHAEDNTDDPPM